MVAAERVQGEVSPLLDELAQAHGEGSASACASSSERLFTQECAVVAADTWEVAERALELVEAEGADQGTGQFGVLRGVVEETRVAVEGYEALSCADSPTDAAVRSECLEHGAVLAQAGPDLRDGLIAGLAGQ
ncbi:hypothetical protein [Allostreptomyces psammosilenae]|uniref:Uncharacterized protein n=1 Tax=Allostreptomyces psammosilenae TaxID=1892865 RepID=A0A853ACM2_9ACTN|nr:hypothetical protein [Allostreptomyces psammosilenae]NYI08198.1 hypothetical protein [Allostreptomyces psammosilenae]